MHCDGRTVYVCVGVLAVVRVFKIANTCSVATGEDNSDTRGVLCAGLVASVEAGLVHVGVIAAIVVHST
jgi:hypothetical protein